MLPPEYGFTRLALAGLRSGRSSVVCPTVSSCAAREMSWLEPSPGSLSWYQPATAPAQRRPQALPLQLLLVRRERTDRNVIPVWISERELRSSSIRVHMRLLLEPADESACSLQSPVEVIDTEKQEQAVARLSLIGAHQRRMLVGAPLVKAKQDRSIRVEELPEVVMGGRRLRQPKQRLYHWKLPGTSPTPMIVHVRFIGSSCGLTGASPARGSTYS